MVTDDDGESFAARKREDAAGGVGAYFVLRSPSDVSLGAARVQPN